MGLLEKLFGNTSEKEIKRLSKTVDQIEALEPMYRGLTDEGLKAKTGEFKKRLAEGETLDDILPEAFATVREAARRVTGMFPYRVQLIGGIILHQGRIAEMKTGEGKTLVAVLPSYLNALSGKAVHVVTVNDYLATRDATEMGRIHRFLGLSVGVITAGIDPQKRKQEYMKDIVYGTNNEFGFDYLRDNMMKSAESMVQRDLSFAIVDEVDSILIDEARTPLIISGPSDKSSDMYVKADKLACTLEGIKVKELDNREVNDDMNCDYIIDEKHRSVVITASGYKKIEEYFKIENSADPENAEIIHHITQAIRAHGTMERDKDYIVEDGQVIIVDEFTGRLMHGRQYNNGLHQAIEAKEKLKIKKETITLATITLQNYFRMYSKISGMTGTAKTEEEEFGTIYKLDVVEIPTNKPVIRKDHNDRVYFSKAEKYDAIIKQIMECHEKKQPILVGTTSVEKSEEISKILKKRNVPHKVLNAKNHRHEADIVAQAGEPGAITIATNMAGRGTDILLGGNFRHRLERRTRDYKFYVNVDEALPKELGEEEIERIISEFDNMSIENMMNYTGKNPLINAAVAFWNSKYDSYKDEWEQKHKEAIEAGGLFILGTERHESRRIDNQLRGRSGRQGDPGESCFVLSLEDDLLRIFGGDKVKSIAALGGEEMKGMPIQLSMMSSIIERAQKNLEAHNFAIRKSVIQFDDVVNQQREIIYKQRRDVLTGKDMHDQILKMMDSYVAENLVAEDLMGCIERSPVLKAVFESDFFKQDETDSVVDDFQKAIKEFYEDKVSKMPLGIHLGLERTILLTNVDKFWRDHIDAMAELQKGVGLRGYGAKDPVIEYKTEGLDMFNDMTTLIRQSTVEQLILVDFQFQRVKI